MNIIALSLLNHYSAEYGFKIKTSGFSLREKIFLLGHAERVSNCRELLVLRFELDKSHLRLSVFSLMVIGQHKYSREFDHVGPWTGSGTIFAREELCSGLTGYIWKGGCCY